MVLVGGFSAGGGGLAVGCGVGMGGSGLSWLTLGGGGLRMVSPPIACGWVAKVKLIKIAAQHWQRRVIDFISGPNSIISGVVGGN